MPLYRCTICGEKFPGVMLGESSPIGFYTTRFVDAVSQTKGRKGTGVIERGRDAVRNGGTFRDVVAIQPVRIRTGAPSWRSEDIISLTEFKNDAAGWIKRLQKRPPVVLTQNGRGTAVVQSYEEYQRSRVQLALLMRVNRALADDRAGRSIPHAKVMRQLRKPLNQRLAERE